MEKLDTIWIVAILVVIPLAFLDKQDDVHKRHEMPPSAQANVVGSSDTNCNGGNDGGPKIDCSEKAHASLAAVCSRQFIDGV